MTEFINSLWPYFSEHIYIFLFLGMLVGGETVLLPAIYLASKGKVSFPMIISLSILATVLSDIAWYIVGRSFPLQRILSWKLFSKKREFYEKMLGVFKKHDQRLLFVSKFVYGTRTVVQILSGVVKMPYARYSIVNLAGTTIYLLSITLIALITRQGLASFEELPYNEYVSVGIFILIIVIAHICLKKWLGKNFIAPLSRPGTKKKLSEKQ